MLGKIRTFFELPNSHKVMFIKISMLVPLVEIGIKTIKFKRTFNLLNTFLKKELPLSPENEAQIVQRYINYLYLYQKQFFSFGKCLASSLALWFLLARKGIKTDLRFGMKKENKKLLAHSWLEYNGEALVSKSEIAENYIPFAESILTEVTK